ncbi:hypothetical protein RSAG8_03255, partial [Rhizoctonia solani AG-8 WAC10335]
MLSARISYSCTTFWFLFLFLSPSVKGRTLPNIRRQVASTPLKAGLGWGGGGNISQFEGHEVSWYFTWSPQSWVAPPPAQLEFVPQLWGERDAQSFASVVNATSIVTTSGRNGKKWMQDFFALCAGSCTVDFLALHWYGNVAEEFIAYLEDFHNTFQRPIWVTEYSCQNFVNGAQCTYEEIVQFLNITQTYMDQTPWVERYAWFGAMASLPNNVNQLTALMDTSGTINDLGRQYIGSPTTQPNPTSVSSAVPTSTAITTSSLIASETSTTSSSIGTSSTSSRAGTSSSLTATPATTTSPYVTINAALPTYFYDLSALLSVVMLSCFLAG